MKTQAMESKEAAQVNIGCCQEPPLFFQIQAFGTSVGRKAHSKQPADICLSMRGGLLTKGKQEINARRNFINEVNKHMCEFSLLRRA